MNIQEKPLNIKLRGFVSKMNIIKMIESPINRSDLIPIQVTYSHRIMLLQVSVYKEIGIVTQVFS